MKNGSLTLIELLKNLNSIQSTVMTLDSKATPNSIAEFRRIISNRTASAIEDIQKLMVDANHNLSPAGGAEGALRLKRKIAVLTQALAWGNCLKKCGSPLGELLAAIAEDSLEVLNALKGTEGSQE